MKEKNWLIVCDIDGTLLVPERGNPGLGEFARLIEGSRDRLIFAVNSGRSLGDIAAVAEVGPIPRPDWIMCDVGTSLLSGFTPDTEDSGWRAVMEQDWGREEIRAAIAGCPGLAEQEAWHQHQAKLSYYFTAPVADAFPELLRRTAPWREGCKTIVTVDYFLDVMPLWGGKGAPIEYLARKLGIPDERVVVAGDSGNDRDMLTRGFKPIVVANHASDLADIARAPGTFLSRLAGAAGVLEGLAHYGVT
jgi:sucrose-phosphate synthase